MTEKELVKFIGKRLEARLFLAVDPPTSEEIEAAEKKNRKKRERYRGFRSSRVPNARQSFCRKYNLK
jgi:hypothetical protein